MLIEILKIIPKSMNVTRKKQSEYGHTNCHKEENLFVELAK